MFRGIKTFFRVLFIAAVLFMLWQWAKGYFSSSTAPREEETATLTSAINVTPFNVLLVQQEAGGDKRIVQCGQDCQTQNAPSLAQNSAQTNGTDWFYYVTTTNKKGDELTQLVTSQGHSKPKIIAAQTDLIKPRGLFLDPTGKRLAYFLDNINEPSKKLTEVWLYDIASGSVTVIAEKLHVPDMMTRLRWNSAGTRLWFVANSGTASKPKVELIVLNADSHTPKASFSKLDWDALKDIADKGTMDIDSAGQRVGYSKPVSPGFDKFVITDPKGQQFSAAMPGTIPFIEWLPDGNLVYAVQNNLEFGFWRTANDRATLLASQRGVLRSARGDGAGEHIIYAADTAANKTALYVLDTKTKTIAEQQKIPAFGDSVFVVQAKPASGAPTSTVAGITSVLKDEEIAAFIDKNLADITQDTKAQKSKFITTAEANTVILDYRDKSGVLQRLVMTVRDAVYPEWSIRARYQDVSGTWQKTQGGGVSDPKPQRLYEWETSLNQWILKETYTP